MSGFTICTCVSAVSLGKGPVVRALPGPVGLQSGWLHGSAISGPVFLNAPSLGAIAETLGTQLHNILAAVTQTHYKTLLAMRRLLEIWTPPPLLLTLQQPIHGGGAS